MVCELNDKEAAALNVKSFMKSFGREVSYEKLARERGGAHLYPLQIGTCMPRHRFDPLQPPTRCRLSCAVCNAGSSTVVISIDRLATLLHICATFRGGKYKQKVTAAPLPHRPTLPTRAGRPGGSDPSLATALQHHSATAPQHYITGCLTCALTTRDYCALSRSLTCSRMGTSANCRCKASAARPGVLFY